MKMGNHALVHFRLTNARWSKHCIVHGVRHADGFAYIQQYLHQNTQHSWVCRNHTRRAFNEIKEDTMGHLPRARERVWRGGRINARRATFRAHCQELYAPCECVRRPRIASQPPPDARKVRATQQAVLWS